MNNITRRAAILTPILALLAWLGWKPKPDPWAVIDKVHALLENRAGLTTLRYGHVKFKAPKNFRRIWIDEEFTTQAAALCEEAKKSGATQFYIPLNPLADLRQNT